jgi:adenylate kinase
MAAGELVPDALMLALLFDALAGDGFILDGFPRTTAQAEALDGELERLRVGLPRAIALELADDILVERLAGRRICRARLGRKMTARVRRALQPLGFGAQ